MKDGKSYLPWPGADDRIVVREMLIDPLSGQWYECREFVKKLVQVQAKNMSRDSREDIAQDAMIQIHKSLPSFQHHCMFRTWLYGIVRSCIIDVYRKNRRTEPFTTPLGDPRETSEGDGNSFSANTMETVEDECITRAESRKALAALQEYVSTHSHPKRNGQILNLVLFESFSLEDAAKAVGCSAPVVGYVVREAKRYVRSKLRFQRSPKTSSNPDLYVRKGDTLLELGRYAEALESYKEAIRLAPDLSSAYRGQGRTYEQLGEQAFENLKRSAQECYTMARELGVDGLSESLFRANEIQN